MGYLTGIPAGMQSSQKNPISFQNPIPRLGASDWMLTAKEMGNLAKRDQACAELVEASILHPTTRTDGLFLPSSF
jgi:hypothetical protein